MVICSTQAKEEIPGKLLAGEVEVDVLARGDGDTVNLGGDRSLLAQRINHHYLEPVAHSLQYPGLHHVTALVDGDFSRAGLQRVSKAASCSTRC